MKKVILYTAISMCFASTYPMVPLFRGCRQAIPSVRNVGYQSRQLFEPTTIAATAAGAYGLKKVYNYLRDQRSIGQAKNMVVNPNAYADHSFDEMIKKLANMSDRSTHSDITGNPYSSKNNALLNTLALAKLEKQYDISFHLNPKRWVQFFKPAQLIHDILDANRYHFYREFTIPASIRRGLSIINNNPDLRNNFIQEMNAIRKDTRTELQHSRDVWNPIYRSRWPLGKLRVIEKFDEIFDTKEEK